jgi:hypothetical protein
MFIQTILDVARDSRGESDAYVGIPAPRDDRMIDSCCAVCEPRSSTLSFDRQVLRELGFLQTSGQVEPTVISHNSHGLPPSVEQSGDAVSKIT